LCIERLRTVKEATNGSFAHFGALTEGQGELYDRSGDVNQRRKTELAARIGIGFQERKGTGEPHDIGQSRGGAGFEVHDAFGEIGDNGELMRFAGAQRRQVTGAVDC